MPDKKDLKDYVHSKGSLARKISRNIGLMRKFAKIYQIVCDKCRARIAGDPRRMQLKDFCPGCQEKVKPILERIQEKIKRMMRK